MKICNLIDPTIETALRMRSLLDAGVPAQTILAKVSTEFGIDVPTLQKRFYSYTREQLTNPNSEKSHSQVALAVKQLPRAYCRLKENDFGVLLNHNGYATYLRFADACLHAPVYLTVPELGYLPTSHWEKFLSHIARYYPHVYRKNVGRINRHNQKQLPSEPLLRRTAWQYKQPNTPRTLARVPSKAPILAAE